MQALWAEHGVYEANAPEAPADTAPDIPKFFVTFPYPYMNGRLHLGHAFSLAKAEFAARFMRLEGKRVLFPFAFHCTGMPISAAAMKLQAILDDQATHPEEEESVPLFDEAAGDLAGDSPAREGGVFRGKKSKVQAKAGGLDQYDIMLALGIDKRDIPKFTDPEYWLRYFPPLAVSDLKRLGVAVDWRRSFITTDVNPYYDAFVRWQFHRLRDGYLDEGKRESIFSMATNQPCADHDRAEGEGVKPLEYTLIKLKVKEVPKDWSEVLGGKADVFLVAATLRPETMYGQTNCFVLPEGRYGFFRMTEGQVYVCSKRSALNMCYQGLGDLHQEESGEKAPVCLLEKSGSDLVGLPLKAPLAAYDTVYVLPMLTITMDKGTGIVTSVPAEAPDDFACLNDWKTRANWREQFGVHEDWCVPFDVVEILDIPDADFGKASAPYMCNKLKIGSHKEKDKLAVAKNEVYLKGFSSGVLTVGPYKGQKVRDVKQRIKEDLINRGEAVVYFEPEGRVVARSGDECIVALCDQWYLKYGDEEWTRRVRAHVEKTLHMFSQAALNGISHAVGWLGDWGCSRTFGLGSKLPWDEHWLIESLSDSTVYMAYYTVAHILQGGSMRGDQIGPDGVLPEALTPEVFDYIFCLREQMPAHTAISSAVLERMRSEFRFWYPLDLRCSGRDLIQNHLTMSLFVHAAIWKESGFWPRAFYCNGHVMVDSEKMSKSKGNFLTLEECICTYSADATRIACADSGDGLQDANFSRDTAAKSILRLTALQAWAEDMVARLSTLRTADHTFLDKIFDNEISGAIERAHAGYTGMVYSDALRAVWFDMENIRSQYSILTEGDVHGSVIERFLRVQMVTLSPIAPHFCEHIWRNVMGRDSLVVEQPWPRVHPGGVDGSLLRQYELIQQALRAFRLELERYVAPKGKGAKAAVTLRKPARAVIFVAKEYQPIQQDVLRVLQGVELNEHNAPVDKNFMRHVKDSEVVKSIPKREKKKVMSFASFMMNKEVQARGPKALELRLPFDEAGMLRELSGVLRAQLGVQEVEIADAAVEHPLGARDERVAASPGNPRVVFSEEL